MDTKNRRAYIGREIKNVKKDKKLQRNFLRAFVFNDVTKGFMSYNWFRYYLTAFCEKECNMYHHLPFRRNDWRMYINQRINELFDNGFISKPTAKCMRLVLSLYCDMFFEHRFYLILLFCIRVLKKEDR